MHSDTYTVPRNVTSFSPLNDTKINTVYICKVVVLNYLKGWGGEWGREREKECYMC